MNTVWQQYCIDNHSAKEFIELESYVGRKVKHIVYTPESRASDPVKWSETIHTITGFEDDACGDGCCNCYYISDDLSGNGWNSSQLLIVDESL